MNRTAFLFCMVALLHAHQARAISTADILERSLQQSCLDWKIVGVCLWLDCGLRGCKVRATPRIAHHLPDLVFTAYDHTGDSPWKETAALATALLPWQGGSYPSMDVREGSSLRFKEVDAIGHPLPLVRKIFDVPYLCRSQAKALFPYFLSALDLPTWRDGGTEVLRAESLTPGLREIGNWPAHTWGAIFPRTGFVLQTEDAKAAAVAAQRACDIVTQPDQARIYTPLGYAGHRNVHHGDVHAASATDCADSGGLWTRKGCAKQTQIAWLPPINETNARWQMLHPITDTRCGPFGQTAEMAPGRGSADGSYVWNLWRRYECCVPGKGKFLRSQSL